MNTPVPAVRASPGGSGPARPDRRLAFDRYGDGETTIALLHGVGGGRSIWSDAIY